MEGMYIFIVTPEQLLTSSAIVMGHLKPLMFHFVQNGKLMIFQCPNR